LLKIQVADLMSVVYPHENRPEGAVESFSSMVIIFILRQGLPGSPTSRFSAAMAAPFGGSIEALYCLPTPTFKIRRIP
jgi:hypothetical protein